ncbi:10093_t:CDS:2 [Paraglomus occultum]|uniref:10093_t:CDS:1 n=1 Tax=Paraglomus occultum TaxID=144539 RepID=A0A9N8YX36_9GLOM|nr:10093_t:CDS:2 [Paraglomus occultum]
MSTPATNPTSRHLTTTTTNSRTLSKTAEPGNSSSSSIQQPPPSPRAHSKSILTIALQKAQSAVLLDSANNVAAALAAYKQTVRLLSQVIDKAANEGDRQRLQNIHDTYAERIKLLSTIVPSPNEDVTNSENDPNNNTRNNKHTRQRSASCAEPVTSPQTVINSKTVDKRKSNSSDHKKRIDVLDKAIQKRGYTKSSPADTKVLHYTNSTASSQMDDPSHVNVTNVNGITFNANVPDTTSDSESAQKAGPRRKKSTSSVSTTRSWNSRKSFMSDKTTPPQSDYESAAERPKSPAESTEGNESSISLSDFGSGSEDQNDVYGPLIRDEEATQGIKHVKSKSDPTRIDTNPNGNSMTYKQQLTQSEQKRFQSPRILIPPPPKGDPPKPAQLKTFQPEIIKYVKPKVFSPTFLPPEPPSVPPPGTEVLEKKKSTSVKASPSPKPLPISSKSEPNLLASQHQDLNDDVANKPLPTQTRSKASTPSTKQLFGKEAPTSRRPGPLPLVQEKQYNSRIVLTRVASSQDTTTPSSPGPPRRSASNPGQSRKGHNATRFNPHLSTLPGSPTSPWVSGFNMQSPPLGSPMSPLYRSDSARLYDASYSSLVNTSSTHSLDSGVYVPGQNAPPDLPPDDVHMRPFWLMRLLGRTMASGGYLTEKLYVPSSVWGQATVKLSAIEAKVSSCDIIYNCLLRLEKIPVHDMDGLVKELDSIDSTIESIQNTLARKLSFVESTNGKSRQSTNSIMNWGNKISQRLDRMSDKRSETNAYVEILLKVFTNAKVVADFFGNVICRFVVKDLGILIDKYVKRGGHWLTD